MLLLAHPILSENAGIRCGEPRPTLSCAVFPYSGVGISAAIDRGHATGHPIGAGTIETSKSDPSALDLFFGAILVSWLICRAPFRRILCADFGLGQGGGGANARLRRDLWIEALGKVADRQVSLPALCAAPAVENTATKTAAAPSHAKLIPEARLRVCMMSSSCDDGCVIIRTLKNCRSRVNREACID
jgi:hypothetical protein